MNCMVFAIKLTATDTRAKTMMPIKLFSSCKHKVFHMMYALELGDYLIGEIQIKSLIQVQLIFLHGAYRKQNIGSIIKS